MKLYTIVIFVFFFLMQKNQGQEFAPIGSEWHYNYIDNFFNPDISYFKIQCIGDTVIQGITCKHLTKNNYGNERDDFLYTDGDIVYRLSDNDTFYILYNFAAQIGDTWTTRTYDLYAEKDVETIIQVEDISTTIINGETLRQLYVTSINGNMSFGRGGSSWGPGEVAHITEKLGGGGYLLPQDYGLWDYHIRIGLRCYNGPVLGFYNTGIVDECDELITTDLDDIIQDHNIKISPNPSIGKLTIELKQDLKELEIISIYSIESKMISRFIIDALEVKLNLGFKEKGFYFIEFKGNQNRIIRKVLIN